MNRLEKMVIDEEGLETLAQTERRRAILSPIGGAQKASFGWQYDTWIRLDQLIPALLEAQERIPAELRADARVTLGYDPQELVVVYERPDEVDEVKTA